MYNYKILDCPDVGDSSRAERITQRLRKVFWSQNPSQGQYRVAFVAENSPNKHCPDLRITESDTLVTPTSRCRTSHVTEFMCDPIGLSQGRVKTPFVSTVKNAFLEMQFYYTGFFPSLYFSGFFSLNLSSYRPIFLLIPFSFLAS